MSKLLILSQKLFQYGGIRWSLTLIAILVVLVRGIVFVVDPTLGGENFSVDRWIETSRNVVNGKGYSLSTYGFADEPRPTAVRGPTVVYFFAAVLWLFGDHVWPIVFAQWVLDVATCVVLFFISMEIFQDRRVAFLACLLFAFYLPGLIFTFLGWSEPLFTLVLAGFTLSLLRALREASIWDHGISGALLGLAVLARPIMQFYPVVILPLLLWTMNRSRNRALSSFAVFFLAFGAVLSPWVIRNYLVFDAFIPGSVYSGGPLYEGNFVLDRSNYLRHRGSEEASRALQKVLEARFGPAPDTHDLPSYTRVKGINEVVLNRIASEEVVKLVREHPGRYVVLSIVRLFRVWFHHRFVSFILTGGQLPKAWMVAAANGVLLILAAAAFVWFRGSWWRPAVAIIVLVAYSTAVYALTNAVGRYSVPLMPYVMVFAAFTIVQLLQKWGTQSDAIKVNDYPYSRPEAKA